MTSFFKLRANTQHFNAWRQIAVFCIVAIEISWVTPWLRSFSWTTQATPTLQVFVTLAIIMWLAYALGSLADVFEIAIRHRRWIMIGFILLGVFAARQLLVSELNTVSADEFLNSPLKQFADLTRVIPGEMFAVFTVLFVALRGLWLVERVVSYSVVLEYVRLALIMFAIYGFTMAISSSAAPELGLLVVYLVAALFGVGAGRIATIGRMQGGRKSPFNRHWLGSMLAAVLGAVGLATSVGALTAGRLAAAIQAFGLLLQKGLLVLVLLVLVPILLLVQKFVPDFQFPSLPTLPTPTPTVPEFEQIAPEAPPSLFDIDPNATDLLPPELESLLIWGGLLLGIVLVVGLFRWRILRDWLRSDEETESMLEQGDLWTMLRQALRGRFRRAADRLAATTQLGKRQRILAAAKIRRIYTHLMDLCADLETPRPPAQTPLEFLPELKQLFPGHTPDLTTITNAYLKVRYGELPETQAEVDAVEQAWALVQGKGKALKKALKEKKKLGDLEAHSSP